MSLLDDIKTQLIDGHHQQVSTLTQTALASGVKAEEILSQALLPGMEVIGERFRAHEVFLPAVLLAARAMHAGLDLLRPHLEGGSIPSRGTVVMSALLTTTMPVMARVVQALKAAGLGGVKTVIGGAPVSGAYAQEIGADGYGYDAARATQIVRGWLA